MLVGGHERVQRGHGAMRCHGFRMDDAFEYFEVLVGGRQPDHSEGRLYFMYNFSCFRVFVLEQVLMEIFDFGWNIFFENFHHLQGIVDIGLVHFLQDFMIQVRVEVEVADVCDCLRTWGEVQQLVYYSK
jgi:hypothetical protein